jgi:maleylacetoacetate isomerase
MPSLPTYKKINPAAYVPCLITPAGPIGESLAIIEWLEETFPNNPLLPQDSFLRALSRQLAETINAGTQPLINLDVVRRLSEDKQMQSEWTKHWIRRGLGAFETLLQSTQLDQKTNFCLSELPTLADLCLIPQCYSALRFEVSLDEFVRCKAIYEHALTTPACLASHPDRFKPD